MIISDPAGRASSESSRRERLPGQVDDESESAQSAPSTRRREGKTVVAQNGNSITGFTGTGGTGSKKSCSPVPSAPPGSTTSSERRRSPRRQTDSEGHDIKGSSAEAAARTAPAQLRNWLERAHQEANALYTSGALNGFRSWVQHATILNCVPVASRCFHCVFKFSEAP